jgi:hypothetical protein
MRKLALLTLTILVLICFASSAYASIPVSQTTKLYYDDGSYRTLPPGTYNSLNRVNNIWFVNNYEYTESPLYAPSFFSLTTIFGSIYGAIALGGVIPIVFAISILLYFIKGGKDIEGPILYMLPTLIIAGVCMILTAIIAGVLQGAFI